MGKNNKNPPNARLIALNVLLNVVNNGAYANIALNAELNKYKLDDLERRFATELAYGTVKAGLSLDMALAKFASRPLKKLPVAILCILRLAAYQILHLAKVPDSASCNEAAKQARKFGHEGTVKLVNGLLRSIVRWKEAGGLQNEPDLARCLALQHPQWLLEKWEKQLGKEETEQLCFLNNQPAPLSLRTNTLKISRDGLIEMLEKECVSVHSSSWAKEGLIADNFPPLPSLPSFNQGFYQVQDESSMLVARFLAPQPGDRVIDMCAAPGGKTTHLAELMNNKGQIIACDIYEHKIKIINDNAKRLGIDIIETVLHDATLTKPIWQDSADKVLVDAPCSGLGVLRRRPDLRWRRTEKDLPAFPPLQAAILQNAASYVRRGGTLVYSTCTTEEAENDCIIKDFLSTQQEFRLQKIKHPLTGKLLNTLQLWPHIDGVDGFFIAVLERTV